MDGITSQPAWMMTMTPERYKGWVLGLEPKQFIEHYISTIGTSISKGYVVGNDSLKSALLFMSQCLKNKDLRALKIDRDIIELLDNTDNDYSYRKSAFDLFFINEDIKIENYTVKGVFVVNMNYINIDNITNNKNPNDYFICGVCIDSTNDTEETYFKFRLIDFNEDVNSIKDIDKNSRVFMSTIRKKMYKFIFSLLDLLNNNEEDVNIITISPTEKRINKHLDKTGFPAVQKIVIRPTKTLYRYLQSFKEGKNKYGFKFMVRGHYRHFYSERYKDRAGTSVWVKPYYKGEGIIRNKDIEIKRLKG